MWSELSSAPIVFVLPGLGGEDDLLWDSFLQPARAKANLVSVTYLDWTAIVESGCDFSVLADHVKRQIERAMLSSPLRIVGYSIGGQLGFAVAAAFQAEGRAVESVAILDAPGDLAGIAAPFHKRLKAILAELPASGLRSWLAMLAASFLTRESMRPILRWLARFRGAALPFDFEVYLHRKLTMKLMLRLFPRWWQSVSGPARLLAPTVLFRSEEHRPLARQDMGWGVLCARLTVVPVVGSHRGMLAADNCERLRACLLDTIKNAAKQ